MENKDISKVFERIGKLLDLKGENVFKTRAYYNAARIIAGLPFSLKEAASDDTLKNIKGIGEALEKKILELVNTGKLEYLERLESEIPHEIIEMLRIPGIGPKKIYKLTNSLGIKTIGELEYACRVNRLKNMDGFGTKSQENILEGIKLIKSFKGQVLYSEAELLSQEILTVVKNIHGVNKLSTAGSLRRCMETVKDVDIIVAADENHRTTIIDSFVSMQGIEEILESVQKKVSVRFQNGLVCNLLIVNEHEFPCALHYFTGSAGHTAALRSLAEKNGVKISNYGISKNGSILNVMDEADFFSKLGMAYIPPELRENNGEIDAALKKKIPELITYNDIKGIFHVHTVWSDGANTIAEMAETAKKMGMEYIGISEHSSSASYAGGLTIEDVKRQLDEIDRFNSEDHGIHAFKGIESEILPDGSLDYDDNIINQFDFVIASIHSWFSMTPDEATQRIIRAVSHPSVTILGHPTGRLLLAREGYPVDMEKILDACSEYNVIIELNANPQRLDIDWGYLKEAKKRKIPISINSDAHSASTLSYVRYGINIARKGWLEKEDVFNTNSLNRLFKLLN